MKKFLAILLALTLAATMCVGAFADQNYIEDSDDSMTSVWHTYEGTAEMKTIDFKVSAPKKGDTIDDFAAKAFGSIYYYNEEYDFEYTETYFIRWEDEGYQSADITIYCDGEVVYPNTENSEYGDASGDATAIENVFEAGKKYTIVVSKAFAPTYYNGEAEIPSDTNEEGFDNSTLNVELDYSNTVYSVNGEEISLGGAKNGWALTKEVQEVINFGEVEEYSKFVLTGEFTFAEDSDEAEALIEDKEPENKADDSEPAEEKEDEAEDVAEKETNEEETTETKDNDESVPYTGLISLTAVAGIGAAVATGATVIVKKRRH